MRTSAPKWWAGLLLLGSTSLLFAGDAIPKAAWKRGIGQPLENAGGRKPALAASGMIDDGYWQGAPVGGFTFEVVGEGATPKRPQARIRARTGSTARVSGGTRSGSRKPRSGRLANRRPDRAASKPRSRPKKSTARGRRA